MILGIFLRFITWIENKPPSLSDLRHAKSKLNQTGKQFDKQFWNCPQVTIVTQYTSLSNILLDNNFEFRLNNFKILFNGISFSLILTRYSVVTSYQVACLPSRFQKKKILLMFDHTDFFVSNVTKYIKYIFSQYKKF